MCSVLGVEPTEEEIPPEISDFPDLVQESLVIYNCLKDCWDPMGGNYLGKDLAIIFNLFNLFEIDPESQKLCLKVVQYIDSCRSDMVAEKIKAKAQKPSNSSV